MEIKIINHFLTSTHIEYIVSIQKGPNPMLKSKFSLLFSELRPLHRKLTNLIKKPPSFPPKCQSYGKSLEEIQQRKLLIEDYLNKLLNSPDRNVQEVAETFIKEKLCGISELRQLSIKSALFESNSDKVNQWMKRTASGSNMTEENSKASSIFFGKEYVIEGEIKKDIDYKNYQDNIFDMPIKKKKIIEEVNKKPKNTKKISFFESFFGCCNYNA